MDRNDEQRIMDLPTKVLCTTNEWAISPLLGRCRIGIWPIEAILCQTGGSAFDLINDRLVIIHDLLDPYTWALRDKYVQRYPTPTAVEVQELLDQAQLTVYAAAPMIGISEQALRQIVKGTTNMTPSHWFLLRVVLRQSDRDQLPPARIK